VSACGTCAAPFTDAGLKRHKCKPERDREIERLYVEDERSTRQIAGALGISEKLVRRVLARRGVERRSAGRDLRLRVRVNSADELAAHECEPHPTFTQRCRVCLRLLASVRS